MNRLTIVDKSHFDERYSRNGGSYAYFDVYERIGNTNEFVKLYESSADFEMCPCCGRFLMGDSECHCGAPEIVDEEYVNELAALYDTDDDIYYAIAA